MLDGKEEERLTGVICSQKAVPEVRQLAVFALLHHATKCVLQSAWLCFTFSRVLPCEVCGSEALKGCPLVLCRKCFRVRWLFFFPLFRRPVFWFRTFAGRCPFDVSVSLKACLCPAHLNEAQICGEKSLRQPKKAVLAPDPAFGNSGDLNDVGFDDDGGPHVPYFDEESKDESVMSELERCTSVRISTRNCLVLIQTLLFFHRFRQNTLASKSWRLLGDHVVVPDPSNFTESARGAPRLRRFKHVRLFDMFSSPASVVVLLTQSSCCIICITGSLKFFSPKSRRPFLSAIVVILPRQLSAVSILSCLVCRSDSKVSFHVLRFDPLHHDPVSYHFHQSRMGQYLLP